MSDETDTALVKAEPQLPGPALPGYIDSMREHWKFLLGLGKGVYESGLAPNNHRSAQQTAVVMLAGWLRFKFDPMTALALVDVINGQTTLEAQGMLAVIRREKAGTFVYESGEDWCKCVGKRADTQETFESTWTMKMAEEAGLLTKDNWKHYPKAMLRWKPTADVCRVLFSDYLANTYLPDELPMPVEPASSGETQGEMVNRALGVAKSNKDEGGGESGNKSSTAAPDGAEDRGPQRPAPTDGPPTASHPPSDHADGPEDSDEDEGEPGPDSGDEACKAHSSDTPPDPAPLSEHEQLVYRWQELANAYPKEAKALLQEEGVTVEELMADDAALREAIETLQTRIARDYPGK